MTNPTEYSLVEKPIIDQLGSMGYAYIHPNAHPSLRARENEVLFRPHLVDALVRINGISESDARAVFEDMARLDDNEEWVSRMRGNYSRKLTGEDTHRTIRLIDFDDIDKNQFAVTNQLRVKGATTRKPDLVVYVNGIPLVVIEAKSPLNTSQGTWDAVDQVHSAEADVPRLFHSNLFNIATDDLTLLYGATGAPTEYWFRWPDPWPRKADEFSTPANLGLWALLDRRRLLNLLAHFIVFETRDGKTVKKVCRYQQYRADEKMVQRVVKGDHQQGLIWHTQGSGKSLTMVFAALKLKFHLGVTSERLANPNLLVVTDRRDLDRQLSKTFAACGLPNPTRAGSIQDEPGLAARSRRARFDALRDLAVEGSENWIVMVDECHRTQEKELGAFLRATLPHAIRFGFTGTPVKKGDLDTYRNFGAEGESYLDKYGIDDAVRDGATVPIYYMARKTEWHLHDREIDVFFDQWFANEPEEVVEELKRRGVTRGDLTRFGPRIRLIAEDIWAHYRAHVMPDGFKAQIVAIDRRAVVAYKMALDKVIAHSLEKQDDLEPEEARARAAEMSVCVYTPGQHDSVQHPELVRYQLDEQGEKDAIKNFVDPEHSLRFIIVCAKLLTGFDAPVEQAMYLDNPLTDHNLLQAIARTNRRYGTKRNSVIVDYIGVSKTLTEALAAYRSEDVEHAMRPEDELRDDLQAAHRKVMDFLAGFRRSDDYKADITAVVDEFIGTEDRWYEYRALAKGFLDAYGAVAPDPACLAYTDDMKFVGAVIPYGRLRFEHEEDRDWRGYSEKIRAILREHLEVTGLSTTVKLSSLTDAGFWDDFDADAEELKTAAVRKMTELKKITREKAAHSPAQYEKFSDRVKEIIDQFEAGQLGYEKLLEQLEQVARGVAEEDAAHARSGLTERAHAVWRILDLYEQATTSEGEDGGGSKVAEDKDGRYTTEGGSSLTALQRIAADIDALYASDMTAPPYWQEKPTLRKELRQKVMELVVGLGDDAWKKIPSQVDDYAARHYAKP